METRIIEINGNKFEVDLSSARKIEEFRVGDNIKVLKKSYSNSYDVLAGVIVEFVNFAELPTMIIATFKQNYNSSEIEFINFNAKTEGIEISLCSEHELRLEKRRVVDLMNNEVEQKQREVETLTAKRDWFLNNFHKYFKDIEPALLTDGDDD